LRGAWGDRTKGYREFEDQGTGDGHEKKRGKRGVKGGGYLWESAGTIVKAFLGGKDGEMEP